MQKRLRRSSLLICAFAILAASCGGDANEAETGATTTTPPTTVGSTTTSSDTTAAPAPASTDASCPATDGSQPQRQEFNGPQPFCIDPAAVYTAEFTTNQGSFTMELDASRAPETVNNFVVLARHKYFDGTQCHRIIPGFVVQCGDPTATGRGNPGYQFGDELPQVGDYQLGSVAMANSGPDTNGSQFFIITGDSGAALPPLYSLFGQVTTGFESTIVDLEGFGSDSGTPTAEVLIESVTISEG